MNKCISSSDKMPSTETQQQPIADAVLLKSVAFFYFQVSQSNVVYCSNSYSKVEIFLYYY